MEISDVRVKLIEDANDRLRAVCSVTFDGEFVVRDVKVVDGTNGLFVAMPSRKLSVHCPACRHKNHLRARFCNECGAKLPATKASADSNGRVRLHRDIAHPINPTFRETVQHKVIESYKAEVEASRLPGYKPVGVEEEEESVPESTVERLSDPVEVTQEMTEYDALIAGLKSGGAPRGDSDRGNRPPPPRPQRAPSPREGSAPREGQRSGNDRRPGSDSRGRGPGGRPGSDPRRERGGPRPSRGPAPQRSEPSREESRPALEPVHYEFADDPEEPAVATAPPPPRVEPPPPPRREAPPREARRPEPPPAPREERRPAPAPPPPDDDNDSFGAGIL